MKMQRPLCLFLTFALLLSACELAPAPETQKPPLRVAYTDRAGDYVILVAEEMGFFEKHGVSVEPVYYPTFSDSYTDLAVGKVDAINAVIINLLPVVKNDNLRIVMISDCSEGGDAVVASPEIQSIADLRGKRVGVVLGTFGELLVREMLKKGGLTMNDVQLVSITPDQVPAAIPDTIDAGHTWEPHISEALNSGNQILFSSAETPGLFPNVMTFRTQVIQERPEDVRAFVAAWFEAAEYWTANPQAGNAIVARYLGQSASDISFEGVRLYTIPDNLLAFSQNPGSDTLSIYYVARLSLDFSIGAGYITTPPELNLLLDPSYLQP
jgi:NitT/TauT family transport system substrate-binding protein